MAELARELIPGSASDSRRKRSARPGQEPDPKLPKTDGPELPKTDGHEPDFMHWMLELKNHKNIVRVEIPMEEDGFTHKKNVFPTRITQQRPTVAHYKLINNIGDLFDVNNKLSRRFSTWSSITKDLYIDWTELESALKEADYRKGADMVNISPWKINGTERKFLPGMKYIWSCLRTAFGSNFKNGEIKTFIREVCLHVIKEMDSVELRVESPPPHSLLVSRVLPVDEHEFEEEGSSLDSNAYTVVSEKKGAVVPDVVVYHPELPVFLLSVECKNAYDDDTRAIVQCLHQMLSHMHYQDLHFGFWINPNKWRLMVVHKNEESHTISVWQEEVSLLTRSSCDTFYTLNVDALLKMFKWIHKAFVFECSRIPDPFYK